MGTLGARGRLGDAPGRIWNGLGTPSWAVLAAKLAVLAAMLAVLDAKLAARGSPNGARSPLRTRAQARTAFVSIFRRFCYDRGKPEPQFSSASAVFRTLRTKLAPNAHGSRKTTKIDVFRPQNRAREPRNRARAVFGERKIAREHAKCFRIFKSRVERTGQSAERAHVGAEIDDPPPNRPGHLLGTSDRILGEGCGCRSWNRRDPKRSGRAGSREALESLDADKRKPKEKRVKIARQIQKKSRPNPSGNRPESEEKSTKNRSKTTKNR